MIKDAVYYIELKDIVIVSLPNRRLPLAFEDKISQSIQELLDSNIIRHSKSPYNSPLVIVPKKDNSIRLCVDYRKLNEKTVKESFYFPDSGEIFDKLGGNSFFSTLDMQKGYYQVQMSKSSIEKTAFSCPQGHFEFLRMPFGLCGAPCTFQKIVKTVLQEQDSRICLIYLDDIIVFGITLQEHNSRLEIVMKQLLSAGVKLSKSKCHFGQSSVKFFGHVENSNGITTDPGKTEKVRNWKKPELMKELSSFIGFALYYRRFIQNFSFLAAPLDSILNREKGKRNIKIKWTENMTKSFQDLKDALCSTPVLTCPINDSLFILDTDASQFGVGAVLSQRDSDNKEKVICYASNRLSKSESMYCATRKELLAVVHYVRQFSHYLTGRKFLIRTDHKSLTWLMSWRNPSTSQYFAWISELSQYDFDIEHRKGENHINADRLSRLAHDDNCKQCHVNYISTHDEINDSCIKKIQSVLKIPLKEAKMLTKYQSIEIKKNEVLLRKPDNQTRMVMTHDEGLALTNKIHRQLNHIGQKKLFTILEKSLFWIGQAKDCNKVCSSCEICLRRKAIKKLNHVKGHITAEMPFEKNLHRYCRPIT